jgi:hypothetical protein
LPKIVFAGAPHILQRNRTMQTSARRVVYCNHKPPTVNQQQVGVQQPDAQQIADSSSNENQKKTQAL